MKEDYSILKDKVSEMNKLQDEISFINWNKDDGYKFSSIEEMKEFNEKLENGDFDYLFDDADVKIANSNDINFPLPYINGKVNIPKDLDKTNMYIFYTRENKDSKDYNILNNYEVIYSNDNDRSINVKYSKEHKPLRDYYFSEEGSKTTTINDVELKIYKFEKTYFTEFKFNDYNFDIETSNITEQELSNFLLSILKK